MKKEDFIYLIYKEYRGMITAEEKDHLDYWLSASRENQATKDEIVLSMDMLDDYEPAFEVDLDMDFSKLQVKITDETALKKVSSTDKGVKVLSMKRWMYAAASVVFLLGTVALFQVGLGSSVEMLAAKTSEGEKEEILLIDGSRVWLNENSMLRYPSSFDGQERNVTLDGEAYFEVKKDSKRKFKISTAKSLTTVLGTSFNIKANAKDDETTITVRSGKVKFENIVNGAEEILIAYDAAQLSHLNGSITKSKVTTFNNIAWQSEKLSFRDAPLSEVIIFLSEFFDVKINVQDADIDNCTIDMAKQPADLKIILNNIRQINKVKIKAISAKEYIVTGGEC